MKANLPILCCILMFTACHTRQQDHVIFSNDVYTVYDNRVTQGNFKSFALSPTDIISDYQSPVRKVYSPVISFRFSINSRDNEMPANKVHKVLLKPVDGKYESPVILFGDTAESNQTPAEGKMLPLNTIWTVKVDMRPMLDAFKKQGFYATSTGDTIYETDFKGVYIAGDSEPLTWDFDNLYSRSDKELTDNDGDGIYELTLIMNTRDEESGRYSRWNIAEPDKKYPLFNSGIPVADAMYNMAIDELKTNIRPDGTFRAGAAWDGVWTRDISYSIYLALAYLQPEVSIMSLKAKVKDGRIIQDTGTGGAWPVSSDRVVWSIAAWEIYKYTGDKEWLAYAYDIISRTAEEDIKILKDPGTGLMRGEQSYLDWREQSYPRWMQPVDIYQSLCLGTNAVHYQMYRILEKMSVELKFPKEITKKYAENAEKLGAAINLHLWMKDRGYYGQYLYGGIYPILSRSADNLGESLSILFEIADPEQQRQIISNVPVTAFGTTSIFPQIPDIKPYHNNAVWPFVQSFWTLAAAKAKNETGVLHGIGAMYRSGMLFATNKELYVASTGDFTGSAVNSDKMLWSIAGQLSLVYRLYLGMQFETDGIHFMPFIPATLPGKKELKSFRYRNAELNITVQGTGNNIERFTLDGKLYKNAFVPATLTGKHQIEIRLYDEPAAQQSLHVRPVEYMPATTDLRYNKANNSAEIINYNEKNQYAVNIDGEFKGLINSGQYPLDDITEFTRVYIEAINPGQWYGFSGNPVTLVPDNDEIIIEAENYGQDKNPDIKGFSGKGFTEITKEKHTRLTYPITLKKSGDYYIDVRYANGSGPVNTENKCAIRSLYANGSFAGPLVMPQRGEDEWSNWGFSNPVTVHLNSGTNQLEIQFDPKINENMNGQVNSALIDYIRLRRKN